MTQKNFTIIFAGGGTGGHLYSGIAVADWVRDHYPQAKILFVGTPFGLEKKIVPESGYPLETISVSPLKGSGMLLRIKSLLRMPQAFWRSWKILKKHKPHIVIGIGGYASGPMTLAAHFSGFFTAIIEQNSYPGFTNRILGRFVDKVFITFQKAGEFFDPRKTELTGNPVRDWEVRAEPKPSRPFTIMVLGGSQGAHALNRAVLESLPLLKDLAPQLAWIHQTGPNDLKQVQAAYEKDRWRAKVFDFSSHLRDYYSSAHWVICRAGAGTITELRLMGLPSLLVPYPYATDDHQKFNAQELVDQGAAEMYLNEDLTGKLLNERIRYYLNHSDELEAMGSQALSHAKPRAAAAVLESCLRGAAGKGHSVQKKR